MIEARMRLFEEWANMEPERCNVDRQGGFTAGKTHFRAFSGIASDALLRREVQRALLDRGWTWQIDLGYPVQAKVCGKGNAALAHGSSEEFPGEALLSAYLGALKRN